MSRMKKVAEDKAINKSISLRPEDFERMSYLAGNIFFLPEEKYSHIIQRALEHCTNYYKAEDAAGRK